MLRRKALQKILITTFSVFILLIAYLLPDVNKQNEFVSNSTVEYVNQLETDIVYLLEKNNLLVKTNLLIDGKTTTEKIKSIVNYLTVNKNKNLPGGFRGIIPEKTELLDVKLEEKIVTLDFNKEILNISKELEEKMIESIVYSICSLDGVTGVKILVDHTLLTNLPKTKIQLPEKLTKEIGINKTYELENKQNINKVTIYYISEAEGNRYYVPVTKYVNDEREKIQIIIDNLSSNYIYQPNLASFLNKDVELLNYEIDDQLMILQFNENLFDGQNKILEEVLYTISYSVFDNYDVNALMVQVGEKEVFHYLRSELD